MSRAALSSKLRSYTIAEYLDLETEADEKHEYIDGRIVAMSGGSLRASLIASNLTATLHRALRGKPCRVYTSDARVRVAGTPFVTYSDLSVICDPITFDPEDRNKTTANNPKALFEILSPSTEKYDRGEKFSRYRLIQSLQEYVLIAQDKPRVEAYFRKPDGLWSFDFIEGIKSTILLQSLNLKLRLSQAYASFPFD